MNRPARTTRRQSNKRQPRAVRALLERDIEIHQAITRRGVLTFAVGWGDQSIVQDIIAAALYDVSDSQAAPCKAVIKCDKQMVDLLLNSWEEEMLCHDLLKAALTAAVQAHNTSMVEFLFSRGADPCNSQALHFAVLGRRRPDGRHSREFELQEFDWSPNDETRSVDMTMVRLLVNQFRERYPHGVK